jgi:hypothetical protein
MSITAYIRDPGCKWLLSLAPIWQDSISFLDNKHAPEDLRAEFVTNHLGWYTQPLLATEKEKGKAVELLRRTGVRPDDPQYAYGPPPTLSTVRAP